MNMRRTVKLTPCTGNPIPGKFNKALMATPYCSTYGHPNCSWQEGQIFNTSTWLALTMCLGNFSLNSWNSL